MLNNIGPPPAHGPFNIVAIGEVLWDVLPNGPRLGGASANFSGISGLLGDNAILASRVGQDDLGSGILRQLKRLPINLDAIQLDPTRRTGTVDVDLSNAEGPTYVINENVAWDAFEFSPIWRRLAQNADAVCFGTLAQRNPQSRSAIQAFIRSTRPDCLRIFDMNLRSPHWTELTIRWSLQHTSLLKLNEEELNVVSRILGFSRSLSDATYLAAIEGLLAQFPIIMVCLTLGARGSLIVSGRNYYRHPGIAVDVVDTVGSGDAFLATAAHYALRGATIRDLSEAANRYGSWVASQAGAIPTSSFPLKTISTSIGEA